MPPKVAKRKKSPIRVVIRCSWSGARLSVPTVEDQPVKGSTTLLQLLLRLESALPPSLLQGDASASSATLVCLRRVVPQSEWETTALKQVLEGDDGSAGVVLTLDLGSTGNAASAPKKSDPVKSAIASAASALNIKPIVASAGAVAPAAAPAAVPAATSAPEPMDISPPEPETTPKMLPEEAWNKVLQSNFDAATKDCLNTLLKIIDNLLSRPDEPKVRSIRCANAAFDKRVLVHSAVRDLGIEEGDLPPIPKTPESLPASTLAAPPASATASRNNSRGPASQFNVYKTHSHNIQSAAMGAPDPYSDASGMSTTERQLQQLQSKKDRLERELQSIEADRGLVAYRAGDGSSAVEARSTAAATGSAGKSDSSLVAARMKRMEEERKKREEGGFTTKAMRDLERMKKAKVYSHAQIRVNFSDGTHLHAKFLPREKVAAVRSVIKSAFHPSLAESLDFDLYVAPPRRLLNDAKTLSDEELVPAAKIHVSWKVGASPGGSYLRDELFSGGSNAGASAFPDAKPIVKEKRPPGAPKRKDTGDGGGGQSKEDILMQRMLGKKTGLLGKKSSSNASGSDQGGAKKGGKPKPKWFKG